MTSCRTSRRTTLAAPSWGRTRKPAWSIATCRLGTQATCSSWVRPPFRSSPRTIQPVRWEPWPIGRRMRSPRNISRTPVRWYTHERAARAAGRRSSFDADEAGTATMSELKTRDVRGTVHDDLASVHLMDHPDSTEEIPTLDISPYLRGAPGGCEAVAARLREIAMTVGFF